MTSPARIIAPSSEELKSFNAACERAGRHFAERVRQVEAGLIYELLNRPRQDQQEPLATPIDEADCFDCGLSQEEARDELQRIERSLIDDDAVADALEFMDEYGEVFKGLAD
jgi:hypothetical protein